MDEIELKEWIQRMASGDQQAFQVICEFTCKDIYRTVAFLVVDKQDVEDIVNEVYIQMWKSVVNYDVNRSFRLWLHGLVVKRVQDWRLVVVGFGTGCTLAPLTTTTVLSVPTEKSGIASSISNISRTVGSIVGVAILVVILNYQLSIEKEEIKQQVKAMIQKGDQTDFEKQKILHVIQTSDEKKYVSMESEEGNKLYEQIKWKYKYGVIRSFNKTFLIGAFIFFLALICSVVEIYMNRKRTIN